MEQSLPFKLPIFVRMRYQRSNARWLSVQLRPAQLPDGSHGLCFYRYEMRGSLTNHRFDELLGQQPAHCPLLRR